MEKKLQIFVVLWALGMACHLLRKGVSNSLLDWSYFGLCLLVMVFPRRMLLLALLSVAQIAYLFDKIPLTDNHTYLAGFVSAALLYGILSAWFRSRKADIGCLQPTVPCVCATLLIGYGAAAIAKLNRDFFDPEWSSAVLLFRGALVFFDGLGDWVPAWMELPLPFAVAAIELAVPVLLLIPRLRAAGVILVVLFHWGMSLSPTAIAIDFTLILFPLVFLFLPTDAAERGGQWVGGVWKRVSELLKLRAGVAVSGLWAVAVLLYVSNLGMVAGKNNYLPLLICSVGVGSFLLALAGWSLRHRSWQPLAFRQIPKPCFVILALIFFNAACPYLGLRTAGTFTMYSNLRTAGGETNHFFLPRLPIRTANDDLVEIVDSSSIGLQGLRNRGLRITWHELQRICSAVPFFSVSYIRNDGELVVLERADEDPELVTRHPWRHRWIGFRPHHPEAQPCLW